MTTLPDRIRRAIERGGTITFVAGDQAQRVGWGELHEDATAFAAGLQARGVGAGNHVALLGPTTRTLVTAIQATWLAGATVVVLPLPMRLGSLDDFVLQTRLRIHGADSALVLVDPDLAAFVEPLPGDPPLVPLDEVTGDAAAFVAPVIDPAELAVLQFTSGSTADPKGVMLPHHTVLANLDAAAHAAALDPATDVLVSWLPLYHDMGLIGCLTLPMLTGTDLVLGAPQDFMAAPARWMEWMSEYGGTATAGPNFSYALAARALNRLENLDLSRWRLALNGAEPVDPATVEAFTAAAARHGFDAKAVFPAFGMAELAIAGAFPEPMSGLRMDAVDKAVLDEKGVAVPVQVEDDNVRRLARLGRPVPGLEFRICDPESGEARDERHVGELEIRGTSVTPGYYKRPDATAELFHVDAGCSPGDGWLRTGDLAYLVDGELVVCGRIKDMIIVGGRNVYPEDVERAVAEIAGVRAGNVIAFGVEGRKGREALVKLQRALCRTRYLEDQLQTA
ncbi:MAG: AMP-binding protein [Actinobacteria bacterium]|nr:AMP-binding protein [Actinomycetota bacterium]